MKAVVGIDGSKYGEWAVEWLAELPFRTVPRVVGVHGLDLQSEPAPFLTHPSISGFEPDTGEATHFLESRAQRVVTETQQRLKALGLKGSVRVEKEAIANALLKHAGNNGLLVVGSRGLNALDRFMMGSVSTAVTLHASCPVLVVKEPAKPIRRILFATDGSPASEKARQFLTKHFQVKTNAEPVVILLVHVMPFLRYVAVKEAGEKLLAQETAKLAKAGYRVREFPCVGSAGDEIIKIVGREQPDLIVIGAKGRSAVTRFLQGSVSIKIVQRSDCSVLVVR
ncbi:MAG TPA: universal stress protein [Nitrospira sp.]|nr:universal stress protein [Nitrospira sp.]